MTDDYTYGDEIICPWCGYEFDNSWEYDDFDECDCPECDKLMFLSVEHSTTYTATRKEMEND